MTRFIYGYDLAEVKDFFAVQVHRLDAGATIPELATIRKMQAPYPEVMRAIQYDLWPRYPPYYHVTDYTMEKTFSEWLIEKFTDKRVEAINFTVGNKLMLKQDGLQILQRGYRWPMSKNPQVQAWIQETQDQLKHEQMLTTPSGKTTFDHPEGEHNDLAIAWELSVHGCLKFMLGGKGDPMAYSKNPDSSSGYGVEDAKDKWFPEFANNRNVRFDSVEVREP